jgi:predicted GIY-YIG superfamily endonuclease
MVHWVYIVKCNDDFIYVGETEYLYKRITQHITGRGGKNTHTHIPEKLIGLYKVYDNQSFYQYRSDVKNNVAVTNTINDWGTWGDNLFIENNFTERLFYERKDNSTYGTCNEWYRVRGGKYTRADLDTFFDGYKWASEGNGRGFAARNPISDKKEEDIVDRPLCNCGMPCEVKLNKEKTCIYFVCALKNIWSDFNANIEVGEICSFWKPYARIKNT